MDRGKMIQVILDPACKFKEWNSLLSEIEAITQKDIEHEEKKDDRERIVERTIFIRSETISKPLQYYILRQRFVRAIKIPGKPYLTSSVPANPKQRNSG